MIEAYSFGSMRVLGQTHHNDLKIIRNEVIGDWWRLQGHVLSTEDIADVLESSVEILVVGTGAYGGLKVPSEVSRATSRRGIELMSVPTQEAAFIFNRFHTEGSRSQAHSTSPADSDASKVSLFCPLRTIPHRSLSPAPLSPLAGLRVARVHRIYRT